MDIAVMIAKAMSVALRNPRRSEPSTSSGRPGIGDAIFHQPKIIPNMMVLVMMLAEVPIRL